MSPPAAWVPGRHGATRSSSRSRPLYERSRAVGNRGGGRARARRAGRRRRARAGRVGRRPHRRRCLDPHRRACRPRLGAAGRATRDRLPQRRTQRRGGRLAGAFRDRCRQPGGRHAVLARSVAADRAGGRLDRVSVRVGTCSWADESLSKLWYPPGVSSAEARLRWYAEHFDTVEVNSSYYALPTEEMAATWAQRTPPGFVFHVKAFGMMTRHPVKVEQLPPDMRSEVPFDDRGRVDHPSREVRALVFRQFMRALDPLRQAGKLGGILMQLPQYIVAKPSWFEYLEWARE